MYRIGIVLIVSLLTGKDGKRKSVTEAAALLGLSTSGTASALAMSEPMLRYTALAEYSPLFPFPITATVLERGRERFTIFCAVCHDPTGSGNGKIVQRGYTRPPSYTGFSHGFKRRGIKIPLRDVPPG